MKTLYLLDKNVIIDITQYQNNSQELELNKRISKLKELDVQDNCISIISSIIEGQNLFASYLTHTSEEQTKLDLKVLSSFFMKADVDKFFNDENIIKIFCNCNFFEILQGKNSYDFLLKANTFFLNKKNNRFSLISEIINSYNCDANVSIFLLLVILLCVFDNKSAINVLKIKQNKYDFQKAYNALSDLFHILFAIMLRKSFSEYKDNRFKNVVFYSFDENLVALEKILTYVVSFKETVFINKRPSLIFSIQNPISKSLFPSATKKEIELLNTRLAGKLAFSAKM